MSRTEPRFRYPGSASCTSLIQLSTPESVVSAELRKPGQGFAWGQQWSPSAGPAQGVGSERDNGSNLTPLFCHGYKLQSLKRYFRLLFVLTTVLLLASSRTLQLKVQFHNLKKGSLSISDYVHRLKSIADALISIGNPISDSDLVLQVLSGLPSEYLSVSTSISTRIPLPSFLETRSLLFLHETQLNGLSSAASDSSTALLAKHNSSSQGRGRGRNSNGGRHANSGRGRGRHNNNNNNGYHRNYSTAPLQFAPRPNASSILGPAPHTSPSSFYPSYPATPSPFQCQLCFQPTHTARDCPSLGSKTLFSDLQSFSSAYSYDPVGHTPWYVDTGASSHMTPNPSHLSSVQPYNGNDRVMLFQLFLAIY
ncbi:hypothetical protein KY285_007083 [Solanum tuberosum]|nr:hypothetical protein KY285_007083 [Solanum tuberosum]